MSQDIELPPRGQEASERWSAGRPARPPGSAPGSPRKMHL